MKKTFLILAILLTFVSVQNTFAQNVVNINNNKCHIGDSAWTDLRAPATTIRQGATTKPDFNTDSVTLDFPYDDSTEIAYIIMQMPHQWITGSRIEPHIHYLQNESSVPTFVMVYRWLDNGTPVTQFTRLESNGIVFNYTSGSILQILEFPMIDGSAIIGVSSCLQIKLYRKEEVTITSDIQVVEFDIHYQSDSNGSDTEYTRSWD